MIVALLLLVLQNAASIILQHKIQSHPTTGDKRFDPLAGIVLSELLKLTISLLCITLTHTAHSQEQKEEQEQEGKSLLTTLKTRHEEAAVPAALYTAASFAQSIGASHLALLPYLALSQTKLILTPLLASLLLHQKFTLHHWTATLTMTAGIILAQTGAAQNQAQPPAGTHLHPLPGILAMLLSGTSVALAGIYIERSLKHAPTTTSFFTRNAQLAAHSLAFALLSFLWKWKSAAHAAGLLDGFTAPVWLFVGLQASGGFLVAWVVRVTSSVTKNYAQGVGFAVAVGGPLVVVRGGVNIQLFVGVVLVLGAVVGSVLGQSRVTGVEREVKEVV